MSKVLETKRRFVWAIYNSLKQTPPKEFPSTGEIKSTIADILPAMKVHVPEYERLMGEARDISDKLVTKEMSDEESKAALEKVNAEWRKFTKEHGDEMVKVELDSDGFKTLTEQFNRKDWGNKWFSLIEEFAEFDTVLSNTKK